MSGSANSRLPACALIQQHPGRREDASSPQGSKDYEPARGLFKTFVELGNVDSSTLASLFNTGIGGRDSCGEDPLNSGQIQRIFHHIHISLDGAPTSSAPNEALKHQGKTIVSNVAKANAFAKHYAQVSSLKFTADERDQNRLAKRNINAPAVDDQSCKPFTMGELKAAIRRIKRKGAPGADDIPPSFLKELGAKALNELLEIFNASFNRADIPQLWRHAIVIPLLKAGKPASEIASFRPISLTSCVVKLFERMITERLYNMAEQQNWIAKQQAGFCKRGVVRTRSSNLSSA